MNYQRRRKLLQRTGVPASIVQFSNFQFKLSIKLRNDVFAIPPEFVLCILSLQTQAYISPGPFPTAFL